MPTPRKPKKAIIMIVISTVIALTFGLCAVGVTLFAIGNANSAKSVEQGAKEKAEKEAKDAREELERLKKAAKTNPVEQEVHYREIQAIADIPVGAKIKDNMISSVEVKQEELRPGSFEDELEVVGKVATIPIKSGEPLTKAMLTNDEGGFFIKDGERAMTIPVDQIGGINGAIVPGSYVDIIVTLAPAEGQKLTKTLLQNIQVIDVGSGGGPTPAPPGGAPGASPTGAAKVPQGGSQITSVTLAVLPRQAEMLALANSEGKFHLTLRNETDKEKSKVTGSDIGKLVTGIDRDSVARNLPGPPRFPKRRGGGEIPISFSAPPEGLPYPTGPQPPSKTFTMTIFKGSSPEEKTFEVQE